MRAADPVFNDEVDDNTGLDEDVEEQERTPIPALAQRNGTGALFDMTPEEQRKENSRMHDRRVGLLVGPKNLEKLRAFGYDVVHVQDGPLTPGVAHRGLTD
jgi:hypothetical protein